jgi:LPXTG-site transpeptidase (sortase) family protein
MGRGKHSNATRSIPLRALLVVALTPIVGALVAIGVHANSDGADAPPDAAAQDPARVPLLPQAPSMTQPKADANPSPSPVGLTIPAIKVASSVTRLGLNEDKTVEVPKDPDDAGWYSKGPIPGQNGSSVILGHVDSRTGPAVFYRLKDLDRGDHIAVELSDKTVAHYRVARVAQYANRDFPAVKVYAGSPDRPALNLVTCGGEYDRDAGGYQSNVVVYAEYLRATQSTM